MHRIIHFSVLLVAIYSAQSLGRTSEQRFRIFVDTGVGMHDNSFGGTTEVGLSFVVGDNWFIDAFGRGDLPCRELAIDACAGIVSVGAGLGRRLALGHAAIDVGFRFKHVHVGSLKSWVEQPFDNVLASPESEITHRSGAELLGRYIWQSSWRDGRLSPYFVGRFGYLGFDTTYNWSGTFSVGLEYAFK